jgi:hypothetical protein
MKDYNNMAISSSNSNVKSLAKDLSNEALGSSRQGLNNKYDLAMKNLA